MGVLFYPLGRQAILFRMFITSAMDPSRKLNSWPEVRMTEISSDRLGAGDATATSSQVEAALVSEQ